MSKFETEKLQKVLAHLGLGSRRKIESWIVAGRLTINQRVATLGDRISIDDHIELDGRSVRLKSKEEFRPQVLLYHKGAGEVCSRDDPEGRPTIFDSLPKIRGKRWVSVGRLDFNTAGLLILTTDGELANRLMHPSSEIEREYAVRVLGRLTPEKEKRLLEGVRLDDGRASFDSIQDAGGEGLNHWYHVILREGRNREVRRLFESQNMTINRLIRVRFGSIWLPRDLRTGRSVELEPSAVSELLNSVGLKSHMPESTARTSQYPRIFDRQKNGGKPTLKRLTLKKR